VHRSYARSNTPAYDDSFIHRAEIDMKASHHRYRDLSSIIPRTESFFDYAYSKGVVTLYCRSIDRRSVLLEDGRQIVDFARGSYLGLDNHPSLIDSAISALQSYGSLQWSGARARLNFSKTRELEGRLSSLFQCKFSCILVSSYGKYGSSSPLGLRGIYKRKEASISI
jgi:7-keto-8-aminopelargonate synthetase-like enzyme